MASPVGLRPIWHMLKNTRIYRTNLAPCSKTLTTSAPKQKPSNESDVGSDGPLSETEEFDVNDASGLPVPEEFLGEDNLKLFDEILDDDAPPASRDPTPASEKLARDLQQRNPIVEYPEPSTGETYGARLPRAVQALYLRPLRRTATYGVPCCDLQLRSYSVRSLEFFADFALRAAYYLRLPAYGPVPLPRLTQRWTVPKSHFIFKKVQENFERVTLRRLIQIKDGHPETVELWLAFMRKYQHHGVGMKASVWEYESLNVGNAMDSKLEELTQSKSMKESWSNFGQKSNTPTAKKVMELMNSTKYRQTAGHTVD